MVKKKVGKWKMCMDFTGLNKACSKDRYLLPHIDRLIDGASGFCLLSIMDAYSGYDQIRMNPLDAPKMAEYEALIAGMRLAKEVGVIHLLVQTVSQLITSQVRGEFQKKDPSLVRYLQKALKISQTFVEFEYATEMHLRTDSEDASPDQKKPRSIIRLDRVYLRCVWRCNSEI
ncbi:uncharacterized protein LOC127123387 [Lathyrus oleraceus]|uniref:uncharacterized protein LOC127123387 n=1 Tax=Pisum sativum TaxID=3888 RepID=UPI0021D261B9|nr:uncharacterized protein LOC127123387 [Pisum sativum]